MPVKISPELMRRMSMYVDKKMGNTQQEEEEDNSNSDDAGDEEEDEEEDSTKERHTPYFPNVMDMIPTFGMNQQTQETEEEKAERETEDMLDKHDNESIKEAEELVSLDESIEEAEKDLVVKSVKSKPCEQEMTLFSECLTNGKECEEFESSYFKCIESMN
ncbi:hypothetical protein WA588_003434 [Blastocystis sp. NMH]